MFCKSKLTLTAMLASSILTACGGGGSSTSNTSAAPPASTLSTITVASATPTAASAYNASDAVSNTAVSAGGLVTGVSVDGSTPGVAKSAVSLYTYAISHRIAPLVTGVSVTEACPGGGSINLNGTVSNENHVSSGDRVTIAASNCAIDGGVVDGALDVVVNAVSGTVDVNTPWSANLSFAFRGFSAASGTDRVTVDGDMAIAYSQRNANDQSFILSGSKLSSGLARNGAAVASLTISAYTADAEIRSGTVTTTIAYSLSGKSTAVDQLSVNVKTTTPFVRTGTAYPSSGSLLVSGAASSVTLTALNSSSVQLDFSDKTDGTVASSKTISWTELKSSL